MVSYADSSRAASKKNAILAPAAKISPPPPPRCRRLQYSSVVEPFDVSTEISFSSASRRKDDERRMEKGG